MANDAFTQQALANDKRFKLRVQHALCAVAWTVLNESPATLGHTQRAIYARQVLSAPSTYTDELVKSLVTRPNVMNFATSYDFAQGTVISTTGDADLLSQFTTDWNALAGA